MENSIDVNGKNLNMEDINNGSKSTEKDDATQANDEGDVPQTQGGFQAHAKDPDAMESLGQKLRSRWSKKPVATTRDEVTRRHHKHLARLLLRPWIRIEAFLWKEVGGMYPYLDIPSGLCFLLGSILFTLAPLLKMLITKDVEHTLDWINMSGVILYTVAKALVELRAIYAQLFKGPAANVSIWYHFAIFCFFVGGVLFGADVILALQDGASLTIARTSMSSSLFFLFGSTAFIVDAFPEAREDNFVSAPSNSYLFSSLLFLLGSVFWIVASLTLYPGKMESETLGNLFNFLAGLMYVFGSSGLLILGYFEMQQFKKGPDMDLPAVRRRCKN